MEQSEVKEASTAEQESSKTKGEGKRTSFSGDEGSSRVTPKKSSKNEIGTIDEDSVSRDDDKVGRKESKSKKKGSKQGGPEAPSDEDDVKKTPSKSKTMKKNAKDEVDSEGEEFPKSGKKKKKSRSRSRDPEAGRSPPRRNRSPDGGEEGGRKMKKGSSKSPHKPSQEKYEDYSDDFDDYESVGDRYDRRGRRSRSPHRDSRPYRDGGDRRRDVVDYNSNDEDEDVYDYDDDVRPYYDGDISAWGRKQDPGFYSRDSGSVSSDYTMSSGLSPRGEQTRRPFDVEGAKKTLAYNAGLFGKAQALRRAGQAPKTLGIADDLPDRFAYQQLQQLAGMAEKVQKAIQHNKRVFEKRVLTEDLQILKKVFHGWRAARYGTLAKQQLLQRVLARMMRSRLAKAFFAWKDRFGQIDKSFAMRRKLQATISKGRLRRSFLGWHKLVQDRWWKNQLETRDSRIHLLEKKITGYELRPIIVIRRRRLDAILTAWFNLSVERRMRRMRFEKAGRHLLNRQLGAAWNTWYAYHLECKRHGDLLSKAAGRMKNLKLFQAWNKWMDIIIEKREHELKAGKALKHWKNQGLSKAWGTWWQHVLWRRDKKKIMARWKQPLKAKAFYTWIDHVQWRKRMRVVLDRTARRFRNSTISKAWDAWRAAVESSKTDFHLTKKEELAVQVKALQEENERLRRDNERFVRLIDSGEWGRGRVAELVSAGEVLKGERDALMKLIQSMRKEYEAVQGAKGAQEDELKRLKERMLLGGAARNKMLVKGASSYNALKRAIKQDLVDGGATTSQADPNLLYEIDKLSMERVSVFPDGDINIEAVASAPGTAAFSRPVSAVQGVRGSQGPVYPMNVPPGLPGRNARPSARTVEILNRLQGLTPAELDRVEERLRAEALARAGQQGENRPVGLASTAPRETRAR